jgi:hypothetical protein
MKRPTTLRQPALHASPASLPVYWFESLNQDFRYQLTAIGAPGPNLHIAAKVQNSFKMAGGL